MGGSTTVQAPPQQNIAQEGQQTLASEIALAPQQLAAYQQTAPGYAATDVATLGQSLFGPSSNYNSLTGINNALTSQANQQTQQSNTQLRTANLQDVATLAPEALQQLQAVNPGLYSQLASQANLGNQQLTNPYAGQMQGIADSSAYNPVALNTNIQASQVAPNGMALAAQINPGGPSQLLGGLNQQAMTATQPSALQAQANGIASGLLSQNGQLDQYTQKKIQDQTAAAYAARGLDATNANLVAQAMNTQQAIQERQQQQVGLAQSIMQQGTAAQTAGQQFALGTQAANQGYGGLNLTAQQANQAALLNASTANAGLGLQASSANAGYGLQAQSLANQAQLAQYGANLTANQQQFGQYSNLFGINNQLQQEQFQQGQAVLGDYAQTMFNPYATILGQQTQNVGTNSALSGQAAQNNAGTNAMVANSFNPFTSYASNLYDTNYSGQLNANIGTANNNAAVTGAAIGAAGSALGSL